MLVTALSSDLNSIELSKLSLWSRFQGQKGRCDSVVENFALIVGVEMIQAGIEEVELLAAGFGNSQENPLEGELLFPEDQSGVVGVFISCLTGLNFHLNTDELVTGPEIKNN